MATTTDITRRRLIQALPFIGAAAAVPQVAASEVAEAPHERVHRLSEELAHALGEWAGFKRAIVTPEQVIFEDPRLARAPARDPDEENYLLLGRYVAMTPGQRADFRQMLRKQGMGEFAEAFARIRTV